MLNAQSNLAEIRFVLFDHDLETKRNEQERIAAGKFPLIQGHVEIGPRKKPGEGKNPQMKMSAFIVPGQKFLSLSIEEQEKVGENEYRTLRTFRGTLNKGQEDNYFGYIHEQFAQQKDGKTEYSKSDWEFGFSAKKHAAVVSDGKVEKKAYFASTQWWDAKAKNSAEAGKTVADASEAEIDF